MDWAIVEVVIGVSFMLFLLSIVASAVNEAIAGLLKLRARTLERGITGLLTGSTRRPKRQAAIVRRFYEHSLVNAYGKDGEKPSYLASRSFRNALFDITGLLETTSEPSEDPLRAEQIRTAVEERLDAVPNERLKETLRTIWLSAHRDATEFREGVERWFDRGMERVSGWYKRRAQIILFIVGVALAVAINASVLTAADRLWKDDGVREGLIAQVGKQEQATGGAEALERLEELRFPIGWEGSNRPDGAGGWAFAVLGWLLTGAAVSLGAPFWFDVLGKVSNLRAAGVKPGSVLDRSSSAGEARG